MGLAQMISWQRPGELIAENGASEKRLFILCCVVMVSLICKDGRHDNRDMSWRASLHVFVSVSIHIIVGTANPSSHGQSSA